ncbi:F-actin-monooxygenase MICAL2-like [Panthera uncia]|uniref:F-actin-monooxygenase MICAL2-like n=1 Tax=Panthera uncia TaxID=29064 RepID=UPI0020FF87D0|nr:F-actin-monooxygenase MICAL2-like [Panthera uncia]
MSLMCLLDIYMEVPILLPCLPPAPSRLPKLLDGGAGTLQGLFIHTISLDPLLLPADEPTSPKKPKSVLEPEPSDVEGGAISLLPSEWTSVRISPGEDVVGQDMMAVCVLVNSDDSSSEAEPDCSGSEASSAEPREERPRRPEPPPLPQPLTRHSSLREAPTREVSPHCPEEPQAVQGERTACLDGSQACLILGHREGAETPPPPRPATVSSRRMRGQ